MNKRIALVSMLSLSAAVLAEKPNILWIVTDDHRADSIQAFNRATTGQSNSKLGYVLSPNADQLAAEGVLFTSAYCNSPACAPSRTSMHYGMYPHHAGHYGFEKSHQKAAFSKRVLPELMSDLGYTTSQFGKTGYYIYQFDGKHFKPSEHYDVSVELRDLITHKYTDWAKEAKWENGQASGTQYTWGFEDEPISYFIPKKGAMPSEDERRQKVVEERIDALYPSARDASALVIGGVSPALTKNTMDGQISAAFIDYLHHSGQPYETPWKAKKQGPSVDKPIFVYLGHHFPHTPVMPSKEFRDLFIAKEKERPYRIPDFSKDELKKLPPQLVDWFEKSNFADMSDEDKHQAIRDYYAFCAMGDKLIGDSINAFKDYSKKSGREWMIVYVVGDHGWQLGEQGGETKFAPYDKSNHCAVIVAASDKKKWPAGTVTDEMVEYVDFAPTMLRASGADLTAPEYAHLDGIPLGDTLNGKFSRDYVLGEMNHYIGPRAYLRGRDFAFSMKPREKNGKPGTSYGPVPGADIKWGLESPRDEVEMALFDLRVDPAEQNNVANDPQYVELADWFRNKLGNIVLGDGRVECNWEKPEEYAITTFAKGANDHKLDIPPKLIPKL